jgi:hypothetical protein
VAWISAAADIAQVLAQMTEGAYLLPMTTSTHPHFDDRGTLQWFTSMAEAKAAAAKDGKRIFIEFGREL